MVTWQRGWRASLAMGLALVAFLGHIGLGVGLYRLFQGPFNALAPDRLFAFAAILLISLMTVRLLAYRMLPRIFDRRSLMGALLLLGPCESLIPILIRAHQLGIDPRPVVAAFAAGTCLLGSSFLFFGHWACERPSWLPASLAGSQNATAGVVPALAGILVGLSALLRLT
jgi:hypothetical protein